MIDIDLLRTNPDRVAANLARRGVARREIEQLLALDAQWRKLTADLEQRRAAKNKAATAMAQAPTTERGRRIAARQENATNTRKLRQDLATITSDRLAAWKNLPNLVADDVPNGGEENREIVHEPTRPLPEAPLDYFSLAEPHYLDLERAAKVSGSRFVYLKGELVRLELGLIAYLFDELAHHDFKPILPPVLVSHAAMSGMGYLERGRHEVYQTQDELYLVGTSEQSVGPMHMNETLATNDLPLRYVAFSPCFRREAGSHGKDVRGMMRLHQFDKVEMLSFTTPEASAAEHEFLLERQMKIMDALELPYRVVKLAARDLGAPAAKTYDIETWMPSQNTFRETHSTSNTTDYQSRRLNIRCKSKRGQTQKVHVLNGTALAMSRALIALLENHQQADGSITVPAALHPYVPFTTIGPKQ